MRRAAHLHDHRGHHLYGHRADHGNSYTFTVTATNGVGTGVASAPSAAAIPAATPGAPGVTAAANGNSQSTSLCRSGLRWRVPHYRLHRHRHRTTNPAPAARRPGTVQARPSSPG